MKKNCIILLSLILSTQFIMAQPTQAEIDKMMKEAKAEIDKLKKDPKTAESAKGMINIDSLMKTMSTKENQTALKNIKPGTGKTKTDTSQFMLPPKNDKYLNCLPIRTFNRTELISYLHNLDTRLTEILRSNYRTDIKNIPETAVIQTGTSVAYWMNGEPGKSVLIALSGAEKNPDDVTLLNNVGGILTNCGLGVNAIPVLQYVLEKQPGNNMILNNLGQAYLDLGDDKKAEQYLLQCVSTYKFYPDANLALACIYNSRGNKAAALNYVENSCGEPGAQKHIICS